MLLSNYALALIIPALIFLLPGMTLFHRRTENSREALHLFTLVLLSSTVFHLLVTMLLAAFHLPVSLSLAAAIILSLPAAKQTWPNFIAALRQIRPLLFLSLAAFILLSLPFLFFHHGLLTGDIQKSVFWAKRVLADNALPPYHLAPALFNRDPVDFYTPALHTYTAQIMQLSTDYFLSLGFAVIYAGIAAALIGSAIAVTLYPSRPLLTAALALVFILTQTRFLRYLREPGYHYQNLFGEILLFGLLLLDLLVIRRARPAYFILGFFTVAALLLTHQFTSFLAVLSLLLPALLTVWYFRDSLITTFRRHTPAVFAALAVSASFIYLLIQLDLHKKLSHFFTSSPHLLPLTPALSDYPRLMGSGWFITAAISLVYLAFSLPRLTKNLQFRRLVFLSLAASLLALSQAPRFNLDIPPVRALFYTAIPFSIAQAGFFLFALKKVNSHFPAHRSLLLPLLIIFTLLITLSGAAQAFSLSYTARTNSTLRSDYLPLIQYLDDDPGNEALLVDDYHRRSSSWLILGRPAYSRLSADISRLMEESSQSDTRYQLYLKQLDFEKIFMLGSRPESSLLLIKHNIAWLGADLNSATSLAFNPLLSLDQTSEDLVLYRLTNPAPSPTPNPDSNQNWLLHASTLVNDIGDNDDIYLHYPASLPSTRLSGPRAENSRTYRQTSAPIIPLTFNAGDYSAVLWDRDGSGQPDGRMVLHLELESPDPLVLSTAAGTTYPLESGTSRLTLPAREIPIDDRGFIHFNIINESATPVTIDLIALGISPVP